VPTLQHLFYHLPLQVLLRTTKVARDYWKLLLMGKPGNISLPTERHGTYNNVAFVISEQFWRHPFESTAVKQIQKQRFHNIVLMMPQCNFGRSDFFCKTV